MNAVRLMMRFTFLRSPASHDLAAVMVRKKNDPFAATAAVERDCGKFLTQKPVCFFLGFLSLVFKFSFPAASSIAGQQRTTVICDSSVQVKVSN